MRNDGDETFYIVEVYNGTHWHEPAGHFGTVGHLNSTDNREFSACGEVWQQTGHEGTRDLHIAMRVMKDMAEHNPGFTFRVAKRHWVRETAQVVTMMVASPTGQPEHRYIDTYGGYTPNPAVSTPKSESAQIARDHRRDASDG